ncbi:unnamed protein product [Acanthoscelides obtectus]|uniref:PiggyBac transposable element-derived protein domain-containing protein n=1 Tax=Acanthoscelides obtectus TaxID=200917 RepID=A0A9P0JQD0_ACAOB|nr:unnamed protein product [Acanthoscelides obtectus]CAK1625845.1 hypothetical protein AOBTE_LOCUS3442 [Acanthoscelides obtectus]
MLSTLFLLLSEMSWEAEQKRLQALWDEVQLEEDPDDEDLEWAADEDVTETRDTDSELEQEYNDEVISLQTADIPGAHHFLGKDNKTGWRFWVTMSEQRFRFLLNCLRFDDLSTRDERKKFDKLAPIRSTFDKFVQNCKNTYCIGANATIDEKLEAFRGRCGFNQYIPSKKN